ncbi:Bcr/CflA family efflux MFS transporter [uncultured Clostridium sp.]|uniref:Bcr/CflA family efflux MFS transporter n=1 Tax=uncultured Clostridium sp. TaxID=59620 RepID=UPI00261EBFCD|nr:Bcr/CflA family efflux MFS transporter [uncultured Clostridium sp.]
MTKNEKISFSLIILIPFLMGLGVDLYVPSLPIITSYFHSTSGISYLTVGIYMLGYGLGQAILGPISDLHGRRKILIISAFIFLIVSFLAIFSINIAFLIFMRFLQGISIGGLGVCVRSIMVDVFYGEKLRYVSNYLTLSWSIGPIIAPFIGATLEKYFGWKSNFYLFFIYGLIIYIYILKCFKETHPNHKNKTLNNIKNDLLDILKETSFTLTVILSAIGYSLVIIFNMVGPFIIEKTLNKSIEIYGYIAMFLGTAYFLGTIVNRILIKKETEIRLIKYGICLVSIFSFLMILINLKHSYLLVVILPVYLIFMSVGFVVPNAVSFSMGKFKDKGGIASSLFGLINGLVVFTISNLVGLFKIFHGLELGIVYLILGILSILIFLVLKKDKSFN